ncbi:MAG TPA: hypothetical protein VG370_03590 [Chloroflexota bacterium]|jgi:hypothetical protein|nr:hypothetical protein [Chloroflexota bacterium]
MTPRPPTSPAAPAWVTVSPSHPCPRCDAGDGCSIRVEGDYVRCLGVVSALPVLGGGWLHSLPYRP